MPRASTVWIPLICAAECGLRTVWPKSIPAAKRSLADANSPVTLGVASTRRTDSPTRPSSSLRAGALTVDPLSARSSSHARESGSYAERGWWFGVAPRCSTGSSARRQPHRIEDLRVPRAAAEVATQRLPDLVVRRLRRAPQQVHGRHDQPGRTESALHSTRRRERLLHRMQRLARPQALPRHDLVAVGLRREHQTGANERPVEEHRAGPALALLARVLR